jgi:hypothetical protein
LQQSEKDAVVQFCNRVRELASTEEDFGRMVELMELLVDFANKIKKNCPNFNYCVLYHTLSGSSIMEDIAGTEDEFFDLEGEHSVFEFFKGLARKYYPGELMRIESILAKK